MLEWLNIGRCIEIYMNKGKRPNIFTYGYIKGIEYVEIYIIQLFINLIIHIYVKPAPIVGGQVGKRAQKIWGRKSSFTKMVVGRISSCRKL